MIEQLFLITKNQTKNGKCKNCKITNLPCIKCKTTGCKDKYHIDCALEKGIIFSLSFLRNEQNENKKDSFNELLQFFCEVHNQDFIINYAQYIQAMNQSLDEKKKQSQIGDNNPINSIPDSNNNANNETNVLNNEQKNNNVNESSSNNVNMNNNKNKNIETNNNNSEDKEVEKECKSMDTGSNPGGNLNSNNDSRDWSVRTPVNNYPAGKTNDKNSVNSNNNIPVNNNDANNDNIINVTIIKNNEEPGNNNDPTKKDENNDKKNDKMEIDNEAENKDKNEIINTEDDGGSQAKPKEEEKKIEYKIPEVKYERIDLFDNFKKMNENYCFPGSFFKFHGI